MLPNAVDTSRFPLRAAPRAPGAPFTAVFVGRLVPEKDLATLLDAWAQAFPPGEAVDARLRLVGGGPLEERAAGAGGAAGHRASGRIPRPPRSGRGGAGRRRRRRAALAHRGAVEHAARVHGQWTARAGQPRERQRRLRGPRAQRLAVRGRRTSPALAAALREAKALPPERLAAMGRQRPRRRGGGRVARRRGRASCRRSTPARTRAICRRRGEGRLVMCGIAGIVAGPGGAPPTRRRTRDERRHHPSRPRRRRRSTATTRRCSACAACRSSTSPAATSRSTTKTAPCRPSSTARSTTTASCAPSSRRAATASTPRSDTEVIVHGYEEWGDDAFCAPRRHVRLRAVGHGARAR